MNKQLHDAINKFNAINLMCGTLALELESPEGAAYTTSRLKDRLNVLAHSIDGDLHSSRQLLREITEISKQEPDCYEESVHFFKVIEPMLLIIERRGLRLKIL